MIFTKKWEKITSPPCYTEAIIRSLKPNPKTYEITIGQGR